MIPSISGVGGSLSAGTSWPSQESGGNAVWLEVPSLSQALSLQFDPYLSEVNFLHLLYNNKFLHLRTNFFFRLFLSIFLYALCPLCLGSSDTLESIHFLAKSCNLKRKQHQKECPLLWGREGMHVPLVSCVLFFKKSSAHSHPAGGIGYLTF